MDLRRAISLGAFIGAVSDALERHPSKQVRRRASASLRRLEKEIGVNLGFVKAGVRSTGRQSVNEGEILHAQLVALSGVAERLVVAFDEFQRLANCPGEPLSIIRSALMGREHTGHLSLFLTGSLRERLKLMLHNDTEPIWDQTLDLELPDLELDELAAYLEMKFDATERPISEHAVEHLLSLTDAHPKRTQHVAFYVWEAAHHGGTITMEDVQGAFDSLIESGKDNTDFSKVIDTLMSGEGADVNEAKALFLLAGSGRHGSDADPERYGLKSATATRRALDRLEARGVVRRERSAWRMVDPLLAAWLRSHDPLAMHQPSLTD